MAMETTDEGDAGARDNGDVCWHAAARRIIDGLERAGRDSYA